MPTHSITMLSTEKKSKGARCGLRKALNKTDPTTNKVRNAKFQSFDGCIMYVIDYTKRSSRKMENMSLCEPNELRIPNINNRIFSMINQIVVIFPKFKTLETNLNNKFCKGAGKKINDAKNHTVRKTKNCTDRPHHRSRYSQHQKHKHRI